MSHLKIYSKRKIASKMQNLEHTFVLQESCKTVRCWRRSILLVKWRGIESDPKSKAVIKRKSNDRQVKAMIGR